MEHKFILELIGEKFMIGQEVEAEWPSLSIMFALEFAHDRVVISSNFVSWRSVSLQKATTFFFLHTLILSDVGLEDFMLNASHTIEGMFLR